jgi:hypothetical protein
MPLLIGVAIGVVIGVALYPYVLIRLSPPGPTKTLYEALLERYGNVGTPSPHEPR